MRVGLRWRAGTPAVALVTAATLGALGTVALVWFTRSTGGRPVKPAIAVQPRQPPLALPSRLACPLNLGVHCVNVGASVDVNAWFVTVGPLNPAVAPTGLLQLCALVTAVNRHSTAAELSWHSWTIQSEPRGAAQPTTSEATGGTLPRDVELPPGGSTRGTVCFADIGHPGQVQIAWRPTAVDHAVWMTNR